MALGITTALGSFGQFVMPPLGQALITSYGWQTTLMLLALAALLMIAAAAGLRGRARQPRSGDTPDAGRRAQRGQPPFGFLYLTAGFFVCGWHVAFIAVHLPAYLADGGIGAGVAAWCLALVGLFNVIGSYTAGLLGGRFQQEILPEHPLCGEVGADPRVHHGAAFGHLGADLLGDHGPLVAQHVPLTSGLVAQIFGPRYMATLFGIVFFSHQVGSFSASGWAATCTTPTAATI